MSTSPSHVTIADCPYCQYPFLASELVQSIANSRLTCPSCGTKLLAITPTAIENRVFLSILPSSLDTPDEWEEIRFQPIVEKDDVVRRWLVIGGIAIPTALLLLSVWIVNSRAPATQSYPHPSTQSYGESTEEELGRVYRSLGIEASEGMIRDDARAIEQLQSEFGR